MEEKIEKLLHFCEDIEIKKHFKYNWQMCKKIREFEAKKDKYLNNK